MSILVNMIIIIIIIIIIVIIIVIIIIMDPALFTIALYTLILTMNALIVLTICLTIK